MMWIRWKNWNVPAISVWKITTSQTGRQAETGFYIDSGSILWGYGSNDYGQLGNGQRDELGVFYSEPIRIASDVVSVDMSMNGYFCIYLTSDGKLYGMGADIDHILGADSDPEGSPEVMIGQETFPAVTSPVLIEENVAYARTGGKCIVYLKNDGSVWWPGEIPKISLNRESW